MIIDTGSEIKNIILTSIDGSARFLLLGPDDRHIDHPLQDRIGNQDHHSEDHFVTQTAIQHKSQQPNQGRHADHR